MKNTLRRILRSTEHTQEKSWPIFLEKKFSTMTREIHTYYLYLLEEIKHQKICMVKWNPLNFEEPS